MDERRKRERSDKVKRRGLLPREWMNNVGEFKGRKIRENCRIVETAWVDRPRDEKKDRGSCRQEWLCWSGKLSEVSGAWTLFSSHRGPELLRYGGRYLCTVLATFTSPATPHYRWGVSENNRLRLAFKKLPWWGRQ